MAQVAGYATVVMPYQASPIVVAMGMGQVPARSGLALSLVTALLSFALLVPLDYLWFRLLECWDRDHGVGLGRRFFPGREDAQTMAVRVQRHEGAAEVHVDRRLQDGQAAQAPVAVAVGQGLGVRHGEGQFGGAAPAGGGRFHGVARPQAQHQAGVQREQREGGRAFDGRTLQQRAVERRAGFGFST